MGRLDLRKSSDKIIPFMLSTSMGLPSGIGALDRALKGFHPGQLAIIAGRPGMGKSSLVRDTALSIGKEQTVLFFSIDASKEEVSELFLINLAKVDYSQVGEGNLTDEIMSSLKKAEKQLSNYNIVIEDDSYITPSSIKTALADYNNEDVGCVIVDYLQLMSIGRRENRQTEVSEISRELTAISKEFGVAVIGLSQLNRQLEYRESTRPRLSDLRESGSLEQDAHKVLLLHRPSYYNQKINMDAEDTGEAEIIIAKNRMGKTGIVKCVWRGEWMSFMDIPEELQDEF